jgi:hemolysin activation/secretion protein
VYYRSWGGEVLLRPAATAAQSYQLRVYAEWQRPAAKETDISLPHLFHSNHLFDSNIAADAAREFGTALTVRSAHGVSTRGVTIGAEWTMAASVGTFDYARTSVTTRLTTPLPGKLLGALEVAGGMTGGDAPVQGHWFLGGPATLRGYGGGIVSGPDFWRTRVEVANSSPGARIAVFSDAGWAGEGRMLAVGRPLYSVGVGASFFDGILRLDLARGLAAPKGWRVDLYVDGIL